MFSLAHLSDLHLPLPAGGPRLRTLTAKQALALLAWRRKRHGNTEEILAALADDLAAHAPDHIAVTGDLVNLAWPPEFGAARHWLASLGPPVHVTLVPGNHDLTVEVPAPEGVHCWAEWMEARTPFIRRFGPVALVGFSSAVPTAPFLASGRLGAQQIAQGAALLGQARAEGLFRVVLIHHPPIIGKGGERRALRDRAGLCTMLRYCGAELVLHGHHHAASLAGLPGPDGPIPVVGVPSATLCRPEPAGWNLFRMAPEGTGWRLITLSRRFDLRRSRFVDSGEWSMRIGWPQ